VRLVVRKMR